MIYRKLKKNKKTCELRCSMSISSFCSTSCIQYILKTFGWFDR